MVGAHGALEPAAWQSIEEPPAVAEETTRLAVTEKFVRDILRLMRQPLDAENPELVQRVARKVMKAMPETGPASRG